MEKYFYDCKTQEEAKKKYKTLAKSLHPDKGGSHEQMIELDKQYKDFKPFDEEEGPYDPYHRFGFSNEFAEELRKRKEQREAEEDRHEKFRKSYEDIRNNGSGRFYGFKQSEPDYEKLFKAEREAKQRLERDVSELNEQKINWATSDYTIRQLKKYNDELLNKNNVARHELREAISACEEDKKKILLCESEIIRLTKMKNPTLWDKIKEIFS